MNIQSFLQERFILFNIILFNFFIVLSLDSQSLIGKKYNSFYFEDSKSNIWISSGQGWNKYNGKSTVNFYSGEDFGTKGDFVQSNLLEDTNGHLWFSTIQHLIKFKPETNSFESHRLLINDQLATSDYYVFDIDMNKNLLWVKVKDEVVIVSISQLKENNLPIVNSKGRRFVISKKQDTKLLIGLPWHDGPGYELFNIIDGKLEEKAVFHNGAFSNLILRDGLLIGKEFWGASNQGLINFSLDAPNAYFIFKPNTKRSFIPNHLTSDDNNILITTDGSGLWEFDTNTKTFIRNWSSTNGLLNDSPLEIYKDSNSNIWISYTNLGVQKFDKLNIEQRLIEFSQQNKSVRKLFITNDGKIIIVMSKNEIIIFESDNDIPKVIDISNYNISLIADAKLDSDNIIHMIDVRSYTSFSLIDKKQVSQKSIPKGQYFYIDHSVLGTDCITSTNGLVWLKDSLSKKLPIEFDAYFVYWGRDDFLFFDIKQNFNLVKPDTIINLGQHGWPVQMTEDSIHNMLLATKQGLFKIQDEKISPLVDSKTSLDDIRGFAYDSYRNLWFTRSKSIYVYTTDSTLIRIPSEHDVEFSNSAPIFPNDEVWFATNKGVLTVDNDIYKHYQETPHTYVMDVHVNGLKYDSPLNPDYIENMDLTWREKDLNFRTEVGEYTGDGYQSIKYILNGHEQEWNYGDEFDITYKNLQPGKYTLEMVGIGSNLKESEPKLIDITISAPFYQTWWFRGSIAAGLVLIGFGINYYRSQRKIRAQEIIIEKQQALQNQRNRMAQDLHDEMGSGLTTIKYISNALKKESDSEKIDQIEQTSTNLIGSMRDMLWSLDESNDTLGSLLSKSRTIIHQMCKGIDIEYNISSELNADSPLPGIYRRNIILVIKEAITNVIKHAGAQKVDISFKETDGNLTIIIADDGVGFAAKDIDPKNSIGIKSMKNRIKEMNGNFTISDTNSGTQLIIFIPLSGK